MGSEKVPALAQAGPELQELSPGRGERVFQNKLLNPQLLCAGNQAKSRSALEGDGPPTPSKPP